MKKKILLIDDEEPTRIMLQRVLDAPPPPPPPLVWDLVWARSIEEGCRLIREVKPDVCLLDLTFKLPAGNVLPPETIAILRERLADELPVMILTGHVDPDDEWSHGRQWKEGRYAGAVGWLRKDRWLEPQNRPFLLHAINDGILEFRVRKEMGVVFRGSARVQT